MRILKQIYLNYIRFLLFRILFILTNSLRKKPLKLEDVKNIIIIGQNRIGDNVLSIPALRTISFHFKNTKLTIISNRYVKDILEIDGTVDEILFYKKERILGKLSTLLMLLKRRWDLGIDLTCDYTFLPAFLLFISKARFRVGYNIKERGFLFHRAIKWSNQSKHFVDRLSDILKEIGLEVLDKKASLKVPDDSKDSVDRFLKSKGVLRDDFVVGIHPGGYYPTQRWPLERFAKVANEIIRKYRAKIIIIAGEKEKHLLDSMNSLMNKKPVEVYNFSIPKLMGLIEKCRFLICNNTGVLHLATALNIPTISTMGPTDSVMWWPQGENNIVLKKNLPCLGCRDAICSTRECLDLITVDDMLKAVDIYIQKLGKD